MGNDRTRGTYLRRAAVEAASRGWHVFPLRPGTKRPAVDRGWETWATVDTATIEQRWASAPYNIGIATGPSGLVVIDLDASHDGSPHGRQKLLELAKESNESIPRATFTVTTPNDGWHLYFRAPAHVRIGNSIGRVGPYIDTRGIGGYVVGPGSVINGRRYRIACPDSPAPLPVWLRTALIAPALEPVSTPSELRTPSSAYIRAALDGEVHRVAIAEVGQRNHALFRAAARLGEFVADGHISVLDARSALLAAATAHVGIEQFSTAEAVRTIESGLRRGRNSTASRSRGSATGAALNASPAAGPG